MGIHFWPAPGNKITLVLKEMEKKKLVMRL